MTVIALCALHEFNLEQEMTQVSLIDLDGISILLNLLKTDHRRCMVGIALCTARNQNEGQSAWAAHSSIRRFSTQRQ